MNIRLEIGVRIIANSAENRGSNYSLEQQRLKVSEIKGPKQGLQETPGHPT
jgi:hypothetical protein